MIFATLIFVTCDFIYYYKQRKYQRKYQAMGGSQFKNQQNNIVTLRQWRESKHSTDVQTYVNPLSKDQCESRRLLNLTYENLESYTNRKIYPYTHNPLIYDFSILSTNTNSENPQLVTYDVEVISQVVLFRFSNIQFNSKMDTGFYRNKLEEVFIGFQYLYQRYGAFKITNNLIGWTQNKITKVWVNQHFYLNSFNRNNATEKTMIQDIIQIFKPFVSLPQNTNKNFIEMILMIKKLPRIILKPKQDWKTAKQIDNKTLQRKFSKIISTSNINSINTSNVGNPFSNYNVNSISTSNVGNHSISTSNVGPDQPRNPLHNNFNLCARKSTALINQNTPKFHYVPYSKYDYMPNRTSRNFNNTVTCGQIYKKVNPDMQQNSLYNYSKNRKQDSIDAISQSSSIKNQTLLMKPPQLCKPQNSQKFINFTYNTMNKDLSIRNTASTINLSFNKHNNHNNQPIKFDRNFLTERNSIQPERTVDTLELLKRTMPSSKRDNIFSSGRFKSNLEDANKQLKLVNNNPMKISQIQNELMSCYDDQNSRHKKLGEEQDSFQSQYNSQLHDEVNDIFKQSSVDNLGDVQNQLEALFQQDAKQYNEQMLDQLRFDLMDVFADQ